MAERRYLRAEIAIANQDIDLATSLLSGISTDRARAILSESQDAGTVSPALVEGDSAAVDLGSTQANGVLSVSRALISDSEKAREGFAGLLGQFPTPRED